MASSSLHTAPQDIVGLLRSFSHGGSEDELQRIITSLRECNAVDELLAIAQDKFGASALRLSAMVALRHFRSEETERFFLDELEAPSRQRQAIAMQTLGVWGVQRAVPHLAKRLRRQRHSTQSQPLLLALAQIATDDALGVIRMWIDIADLSLLKERLMLLSALSEACLLDVIDDVCLWAEPEAQELLVGAKHELERRVAERVDETLEPLRGALEEALFF